jgi:hypothetical protein
MTTDCPVCEAEDKAIGEAIDRITDRDAARQGGHGGKSGDCGQGVYPPHVFRFPSANDSGSRVPAGGVPRGGLWKTLFREYRE